eukprot:804982-Pelagomonas_calceolata.AAC.3
MEIKAAYTHKHRFAVLVSMLLTYNTHNTHNTQTHMQTAAALRARHARHRMVAGNVESAAAITRRHVDDASKVGTLVVMSDVMKA